jgi:hypothetical protein
MSAKVRSSRVRTCLKKPAFYIVVKWLDDEGNLIVSYMNRSGTLFSKMDSDGDRPENGGQYFHTQSEAQAVLDQHEGSLK